MVTKSDFTEQEWQMLLGAPMMAGMAVTFAEPGGLIGMLQEGWAGARSLLDAKNDPSGNALAKAIADDLATSGGRTSAQQFVKARLTGKSAAELRSQIIAALVEVGSLIDKKAGTEAPAIKSWLQQTARHVAEASTEGGFLGFSGVAVSDAEKATLDDVAKALRV